MLGDLEELGADDGNATNVGTGALGTGALVGLAVVGTLLGEADGWAHELHVSGHCVQASLPAVQRRPCSLVLLASWAQLVLAPLEFKNTAVSESEQPSSQTPHDSSHTNHALRSQFEMQQLGFVDKA
jgi:hypothetical protein